MAKQFVGAKLKLVKVMLEESFVALETLKLATRL